MGYYVNKLVLMSQKAKRILDFINMRYMAFYVGKSDNIIIDSRKRISMQSYEDILIKMKRSDKELIIMADILHIERLVMNLTTNAKDAMPGIFPAGHHSYKN